MSAGLRLNQRLRSAARSQSRAYICGPMTGLPDLNHPAFNEAAQRLRDAGFEAVNPVDLNPPPLKNLANMTQAFQESIWRACMKRDIAAMVLCDVLVLLPNWSQSRGAMIEVQLAESLGIPAWPFDDFIQERKSA